jgi:hypothetical protein
MELELKTADVLPATLWQGQVLCDDRGQPFAIVWGRADIGGTVTVGAKCVPSGEFDVRTFSNDHRFMRTNGCAGVTSWPSYAHAWADCERAMSRRSREEINVWHQYSAIYYAGTARPVRVSEFDEYMTVEFPPETTAKVVAW